MIAAAGRGVRLASPPKAALHAAIARYGWSARVLAAALLASGLAACVTKDYAPPRGPPTVNAIGAHLVPTNRSTVGGLITFEAVDGGVKIVAEVLGLQGAGIYRIVIHANGNCTSPNAFSAGPPMVFAGSSGPIVVEFSAQTEGRQSTVARIPGLTVDGLVGRSVVVHQGVYGSLEAQPGVPNDRVGCGAIGAMRPLF